MCDLSWFIMSWLDIQKCSKNHVLLQKTERVFHLQKLFSSCENNLEALLCKRQKRTFEKKHFLVVFFSSFFYITFWPDKMEDLKWVNVLYLSLIQIRPVHPHQSPLLAFKMMRWTPYWQMWDCFTVVTVNYVVCKIHGDSFNKKSS